MSENGRELQEPVIPYIEVDTILREVIKHLNDTEFRLLIASALRNQPAESMLAVPGPRDPGRLPKLVPVRRQKEISQSACNSPYVVPPSLGTFRPYAERASPVTAFVDNPPWMASQLTSV